MPFPDEEEKEGELPTLAVSLDIEEEIDEWNSQAPKFKDLVLPLATEPEQFKDLGIDLRLNSPKLEEGPGLEAPADVALPEVPNLV